jgi:uncharacterized protein YaaW (UPF0174 family)
MGKGITAITGCETEEIVEILETSLPTTTMETETDRTMDTATATTIIVDQMMGFPTTATVTLVATAVTMVIAHDGMIRTATEEVTTRVTLNILAERRIPD